MSKWLNRLIAPFSDLMKQSVESFIRLETSDDEHTIVAEDGSLVSYIKVEGSRQIIGEDEYNRIIDAATIKLGSRFDRPGHALQVYFVRDPQRIRRELQGLLRGNRTAAKSMGLELDDLLEEKERHLAHFMSWEEIYFVMWTRPSILSKSDFDRLGKDIQAKAKKWPHAPDAQYPLKAIDQLRARHKSFVGNMDAALEEMGLQARVMEVHDALQAVRSNLFPDQPSEFWRANLPGDNLSPRVQSAPHDYSELLWPPLRAQLAQADATKINRSVVRIGNQLWAGADMSLGPTDPSPFPMFLNRLVEAKIPFRLSFLIEGGGQEGIAVKAFLSSILGFSNSMNKQIKASIESLMALSKSEPIVRLRVSLATWAPDKEYDLIEERLSAISQAFESWGYAQVSNLAGDPLDCVMSSAMGIACASTAPAAAAPLTEVIKLLPWQRPSSPFREGSVLLRTPDGRVWPYQTGSNLTTTWFDLIFAQPGAGKSVLMNTLNLGTCLTAGMNKLPYLAIIDIGPSSSGLVSLLRDSLPAGRQHEVAHYKLRMTQDYAVNPFDTQLGCRYPLPDERSFLIELMTLLCTPPGQQTPYDGVAQLAGLVVDEMYRWRDDATANAEARPYLPKLDADVDEAISKYNLHLPKEATWWDVVDLLFENNLYHVAGLAQRYAVPTLPDSITACRRPQIRSLLEETQIGASAEGVIHAFERMITSAVREFPILASVTKFDIRDARVCALDLQDVCPQGDDTADRQTAIMYMLARNTLVRSWWMGEDSLKSLNPKYQDYHAGRLKDIKETPKRLSYDEFHRTSKSKSVRSQIIRDVREGRKWGVQIVLASQLLGDFDDDMVDLATGVWILGSAVSDGAVDEAQRRFGLSNTARWIMRNRLTGPRSSGAPALLVLGTNDGRYEQHLVNTLGPIELWALSTSAEDVALRSRLYSRLGAQTARRILAVNFPGGSARNEIRRRITILSEKSDAEKVSVALVIDELVEEMVEAINRQRLARQNASN